MNDEQDLNTTIKEIKKYFEEEAIRKNNIVNQFSNEVISLAYQKISANMVDLIQNEDDPVMLSELLQNYLNVSKAVDEQGIQRQQFLLKLFEQLTKYEQSRYY